MSTAVWLRRSYSSVERLANKGADVNAIAPTFYKTPLHIAVVNDDLPMVELLLRAKADPNVGMKELGYTPLDTASLRNLPLIAKVLMSHGAIN